MNSGVQGILGMRVFNARDYTLQGKAIAIYTNGKELDVVVRLLRDNEEQIWPVEDVRRWGIDEA